MTLNFDKYTFKIKLLKVYTCAIIDIKEKKSTDDINLLMCNFSSFKDCDKILVCTQNSEGNFVVEKYPFENEQYDDQDDVFKVIIRYISNKYRQNEKFSIIYGNRSINVKIINSTDFLDMDNGKKSKIINTVGRMESGQIKCGRGQISIKNGNGLDEVK
ncbi:hypothetical protein [Acetivibrio cellulolyticus]|uniref:hypothetical protein n=1 Tax=Acetivibrio cellulolyticus TaxID=35830 RepID=UPI0001E2C1F2|nr:hypothetical protein [Acetivibrio cellulolyticus]